MALAGVLAAAAVAALAWTAVAGALAGSRLRTVRAEVTAWQRGGGSATVVPRPALRRAAAASRSADRLLHQPGPALVAAVPWLGRSVVAEQTVADAVRAVLDTGSDLAPAARRLTADRRVDASRLESLGVLAQRAAGEVAPVLRRLAALRLSGTLPAVRAGTREAQQQLLGTDTRLAQVGAAARGVAAVLGGPDTRTVLVGLMNNAEARGSGGLLSAYAVGTVRAGKVRLAPFQDANGVAQPPARARRVPAPEDYRQAYGRFLAASTLWKNVTMSPDGPDVAQVLASVAARSLGRRPDVVVLLDVPAAAAIVSATGPVRIDGRSVSGDELVRSLLVDSYGDGRLDPKAQAARRRATTAAASAAFRRVWRDAPASPALLRALLSAAAGRHLLMWSDRPWEQALLAAGGVAGALPATGDVAMPVLNNLGDSPGRGNKLDYYLRRQLAVTVTLGPRRAQITQTLTLTNTAPAGLGPYVAGVARPGTLRELVAMSSAARADVRSFTRDGRPIPVLASKVQGRRTLTTAVTLPRGARTVLRLRYSLPLRAGAYRLTLVPQPLARPATLQVTVRATDGAALDLLTGVRRTNGRSAAERGPFTDVRTLTARAGAPPLASRWAGALGRWWP